MYRFVGNNPVHGWDPYGLDPDDPDCEASAGVLVGYTESGDPIFANGVECEQGPGPSPFGGGDTFGDPIGPRPPPSPSKGGPPGSGGPGPGFDGPDDTEPVYHDLNQCIIANAIPHYRGTIDVIHTPVTIQLQEGRGSVTVVPGALLTGGGSLIGNAMTVKGAFQTGAVRGAPYAGRNGAPIRGGKFIAGVAGKFLKGVAAVQVAWHAALFAGSELVAAVECITGG